MLSITNSLLLMTALFNTGLGIIVWRSDHNVKRQRFLLIYLFSLAIWAIMLIATQVPAPYFVWLYGAKFVYMAGLVIAASFYLFAIAFPDGHIPHPYERLTVIAAVAVYSLCLITIPDFLTIKIVPHPWGESALLNVTHYRIYVLMFVFLYFGGLFRIWRKFFFATERLQKKQLLFIGAGVSITGIAGLYFNIILPSPFFDTFQYIWTGPLFNTVMGVLILYAVFRLGLFNSKVIITELFISLLWIFTFLRTILAADRQEQIFNGILFLLSLGIGYALMRSVRREVEQREEIERLSQEKSEFMTFASHEIRNPITAMRGLASLIVDGTTGPVPADTRDAAQKILVAGHDVLNIIATYLSKSKMELGQIAYDKAVFDVGDAVASIAEGYAPHAEVKGLTLDIKIDRSHKFSIEGDQGKVKEVVGNLIDNSLKYTKQGGITVSVERHGPFVRTVISDTGVGISKDTISQLFKKFSRADAQKVNLLGTGIGLYLAKTFIEAQGGRIWAESDGPDKGSRFILEFPAAQP